MKAQTYLDLTRGLKHIDKAISSVIWGSDDKQARIASDAGALTLLAEIEQVTETCRQIIIHDTGVPRDAKMLTA